MERIKLGWGRRETSIQEPVNITGQMYIRISEGVNDPLYVTALAIDGGKGQDPVIFLSCDLGSLPAELVVDVRAAVTAMQPEICPDWIIMNATHTHAGSTPQKHQAVSPDGAYIYPNAKYREFYIRMCAEAVAEAWNTRAEGGFAYGYGYAVVGHSRRVCYLRDMSETSKSAAPNGHCIMYGPTNHVDFSHYESSGDHFLNALYTFDAENKLTGIVINVPCPSQITEHLRMLSADYWGDVRQLAAEKFGPEVYILPQCAPAGDLSPRILHYLPAQARRMGLKFNMPYDADLAKKQVPEHDRNKRFAERKDIAERILAAVTEVYGWAKKEIITSAPVRHECWKQNMQRRFITEEELESCKKKLAELEANIPDPTQDPESYRVAKSRYESYKRRNKSVLERFESQKTLKEMAYETHAVALGDVAFATNKFELYQDFMHRVQARSTFVQTFVLQLCGEGAGTYLATERSQKNKGYGASLYCNWIGHEGGQQWVEGVLERLNRMKTEIDNEK